MNDFNNNTAKQSMNLYFPEDIQRYLYAALKPGTFHVWYGEGNNGKTTLAKVVTTALQSVYNLVPMSLLSSRSLHESVNRFHIPILIDESVNRFHIPILIIDDDDSSSISGNRLKEFLDDGCIIIRIAQTLPVIQGADDSLWGRTHVIQFKNRFIHSPYVPHNLLWRYVAGKIQDFNAICVAVPNSVRTSLKQVKLLAGAHVPELVFEESEESEESEEEGEVVPVFEEDEEDEEVVPAPFPAPILVVVEDDSDTEDETVADSDTECAPCAAAATEKKADYYLPIVIECVSDSRKNNGTLTINADSESDGFVITSQEDKAMKATLYITADDIYHYVHMYFTSIAMSTTQYSSYKFTVPGFPTTVISSSNSAKYISEIFVPQLDFLTKCWPETA